MQDESQDLIKVSVSLRVISKALDIDRVTKLLGILPTMAYRNGDPYYAPSGDLRGIRRVSIWTYKEVFMKVEYPSDAIERFLDRFAGKNEQMHQLKEENVTIDLFVGVFEEGSIHNLTLSSSLIQKLADMSLILDCSFYGLEESTEIPKSR